MVGLWLFTVIAAFNCGLLMSIIGMDWIGMPTYLDLARRVWWLNRAWLSLQPIGVCGLIHYLASVL